jgi:hypothetical protein
MDRTTLYELLKQHFNETELRDLCFVLNIEYDDLPGSGRADKARELIRSCERDERVADLVEACRKAHPNVFASLDLSLAPAKPAQGEPVRQDAVLNWWQRVPVWGWVLVVIVVVFGVAVALRGPAVSVLVSALPSATPTLTVAPSPQPATPSDMPVMVKPSDTPVPVKPSDTPTPKPSDTPVTVKPPDTSVPVKSSDTPRPKPSDTRTQTKAVSPTPVSCPPLPAPTGQFADLWQSMPDKLGCATGDAYMTDAATQDFINGQMLWRKVPAKIYVLYNDSTWSSYLDTWVEGQGNPDTCPAGVPQTPSRGFGKVWCNLTLEMRNKLGGAEHSENNLGKVTVQDFAEGLILRTASGEIYVLYKGGWKHQ